MQIKVSVIIPVYNTYDYLVKCIDSVLCQTLNEMEIIVINDGSTDNSLKILNQYVANNDIILINKNNEGQGVARNKAVDICRGKYIAFVDSDDYIESDMLEKMYEKAEINKLDITICNYKVVDEESNEINNNINYNNSEIINSNECIRRFLIGNTIEGFSWNKLFASELFKKNGIRYPERIKYEDIPTVFNLILISKRIGFINERFYYYVQRSQSTTNQLNLKNIKDFVMSLKMVNEILKNNMILENFRYEYQYYYIKKMMYQYIFINRLKGRDDIPKLCEFERKIKKDIRASCKNVINNKCFSKKELIKIFLFRINLMGFLNSF